MMCIAQDKHHKMNSKLNRKRAAESETKDSDSETPQPTKDKKQKAAKKKSPKKVTFFKIWISFYHTYR